MALAPPPVLGRRADGLSGAPAETGLVLQRAIGEDSGGESAEAQAADVEAALLQSARNRPQPRTPPDPERVAELVYQRLRDALREEQQRTA
jgi:hypothetical protein